MTQFSRESQVALLARALHDRGLRLTSQRQLVLEAVFSLHGHFSAEQIHRLVVAQFPDVNITTVYRTLEVLEEIGLVTHTHFHDGGMRYHRTEEATHQHLVCLSCGKEVEITPGLTAPLATRLKQDYGFTVDFGHTAIVGLCQTCAANSASPDIGA